MRAYARWKAGRLVELGLAVLGQARKIGETCTRGECLLHQIMEDGSIGEKEKSPPTNGHALV